MAEVDEAYKRAAVRLFGGVADATMDSFRILKPHLVSAGMQVLLKTWVCIIFFTALIAFIGSLAGVAVLLVLLGMDLLGSFYIVLFAPVLVAALVFLLFYLYPIQKSKSVERAIDNDLPFALAHMSAIASSGIPPEFMFDLLTGFKEYGPVSRQAEQIVRNIKTFGMSSVAAISLAAQRTSSANFRQVLGGMVSTIEKGGDLVGFLKQMSENALFDYRLKREKYLKTLAIYADIYTALLVAAPLMMLAVLGVMSIIGGNILGFTIQDIIFLITWVVLPLMNIIFIAFIHMTYPGV